MRPLRQPEPRDRPVARVSPPTCVMVPVGADAPPRTTTRSSCSAAGLHARPARRDRRPGDRVPARLPVLVGNSRALHENFEDLARAGEPGGSGLGGDDLVVDIGANDGTLLSKFRGTLPDGRCRADRAGPQGSRARLPGVLHGGARAADPSLSTGRRRSSPPATSSRTSRTSGT
jgi:hypothetical protein